MPVGDDISVLADWVELKIAGTGSDMPLTRLDRLLKAEGTDTADEELSAAEPPEDDVETDVVLDMEDAAAAETDFRVELVTAEIRDRQRIGPRLYPFGFKSGRVTTREAAGADVYLLLLVLGSGELPYRKERRAHQVEEAYDYVAMAALRRLLGRQAVGVRFARTARSADADAADEGHDPRLRPTDFAEAIRWLRDWLDLGAGVRSTPQEPDDVVHWEDDDPVAPPLGRTPLRSYNDAGVDVVVWWRFADGRAGFPVLLAQCTVQLAWEEKLEDIKLSLWQKWIDFDTVPPQKALVIPFADRRDHPLWQDRTTRAGTILDRVRLLELLNELGPAELTDMIDDDARRWTQAELAAA